MDTLIGIVAIYSIIHFIYLSFTSKYAERTNYEKAVTWAGVTSIVLIVIGIMMM